MKPNCEKPASGEFDTVDRFLDLPVFIIHRIISFLGPEEAYRTSVLSKRWGQISATNPILEFSTSYLSNSSNPRFLEYIDIRMQKYSNEKLVIRELVIRFSINARQFRCTAEEFACKADDWLAIAVRNQVAILWLECPRKYQLSDILLSAKFLTELVCCNVEIPYYKKPVEFVSLTSLSLLMVVIEERVLNLIISSCVVLESMSLESCVGFKTIVLPRSSRLQDMSLTEALPEGMTVIIETLSLTSFCFSDMGADPDRWPVVMSKPDLLRNLRTLDLCRASTDEALNRLLPELVSLQTLCLSQSYVLTTVKISSDTLTEICFDECNSLIDVRIDAPRLKKFTYKCDFTPELSITVSSQATCDVSLHTPSFWLDTRGFIKLKKILTGITDCSTLRISFQDDARHEFNYFDWMPGEDIAFVEEELGNVNLGPPCDIRELKLNLKDAVLSEASTSAYLVGLFWTCRPRIISFQVRLRAPNLGIQPLMTELKKMAKCSRNPLKRVEVEGVNGSSLNKSKTKVNRRFRLYW